MCLLDDICGFGEEFRPLSWQDLGTKKYTQLLVFLLYDVDNPRIRSTPPATHPRLEASLSSRTNFADTLPRRSLLSTSLRQDGGAWRR